MKNEKMDSSVVFALFEEVKAKIDEIGKKSEVKLSSKSGVDSKEAALPQSEVASQLNPKMFALEQMGELRKDMARVATYSIGEIQSKLLGINSEIRLRMAPIDKKLEQLLANDSKTIRKEHVFILDFRHSKTALTIIVMALVILCFAAVNIWQVRRISEMRDNDLKYRYLKMEGKATVQDIKHLESIFEVQRNQDSISAIRKGVEMYEKKIQELAEKIERGKLDSGKTRNSSE